MEESIEKPIEERPLYQNDTTYTEDSFIQYNKFHMIGRKKTDIIYLVVLIIASIYLIIVGEVKAIGIAGLGIAVAFILLYFLLPKLTIRRLSKTDQTILNSKNHFSFYTNELIISNEVGSSKFPYDKLYRVYETEDFMYLYINDRQAFLVNKAGFDGDVTEEVSHFLKEKMGRKYIVRFKNRKDGKEEKEGK